MFSYIWHTVFFDPIYNTLVFFIDIFPHGDVGLAIIATVALVKTVILPISIKAAKTQKLMKELEPKLKEIKEKYKDDREGLAKATMNVYKESGMNPLASIGLIFIQIPFIIAIYLAVSNGGGVHLPGINSDILYSFIKNPSEVSLEFLGLINIAAKSITLAILAGITQYFSVHVTMPKLEPRKIEDAPSLKDDFARNMQLQMRYAMPILIVFVAYSLSATIALYFVVSNVMTIAQEFFIRKHR